MRNRQALWLLVAIPIAAALKFVPFSPSESGGSPQGGGAVRPEAHPPAGDSPGRQAPGGGAGDEAGFTAVLPEAGKAEYLIVTLPDPFDSSSGYRFDTTVGAIQRAAETQSYVPDRHYYPWKQDQDGTEKEPARDRALAIDIGARPAGKQADERGIIGVRVREQRPTDQDALYRREPGVLVFRRPPPDDPQHPPARQGPHPAAEAAFRHPPPDDLEYLVVFLVGETATRGIHGGALRASLDAVEKGKGCDEVRAVRVLGPYFSGSRASLAAALRNWHGRSAAMRGRLAKPDVRVVSGSATQINGREFEGGFPHGVVSFRTTVHPEYVLRQTVMDYLGRRVHPSQVAVLQESNTTFGMESGKKGRDSQPPPDSGTRRGQSLHLPFPLHVSDIRAAYGKTGAGAETPLPQLPAFAAKLRIPVNEGHEPVDTEPSLTPQTTAVTTERALAQMLATLARERVKYVVILATDLKDKIFLATLIRDQLPDVQLIVSGDDILLSHPAHRYYFLGAIVVSTYPLQPRNQEWSFPFGGRATKLVLTGESDYGVYNAAVALLARPDGATRRRDLRHLLQYGPPFHPTPPSPGGEADGERCALAALGASGAGLLGSPDERGPLLAASVLFPGRTESYLAWVPPVWLSVVGQDGSHPIYWEIPGRARYEENKDGDLPDIYENYEQFVYRAELPAAESAQTASAEPAPQFKPQYPGSWVWAFIVLMGFCSAGFFRKCRAFFKSEEPPRGLRHLLKELVWPLWVREPNKPGPYPYVLVCSASLLVVCVYILWQVLGPPIWLWYRHDGLIRLGVPDGIMPVLAVIIGLWLGWITLVSLRPWLPAPPGGSWKGAFGLMTLDLANHLLIATVCFLASGVLIWCRPAPAFPWLLLSLLFALLGASVVCVLAGRPGRAIAQALITTVLLWLVALCLVWSLLDPVGSGGEDVAGLLVVERAGNLVSGVSPVLPMIWLALAFYCLAYCQLKRWALLRFVPAANPFPEGARDGRLRDLFGRQEALHRLLRAPASTIFGDRLGASLAVLVVLLFVSCRVYSKWVPSVEGVFHDCLFLLALAGFLLFLAYVFGQSKYLWDELRQLLGGIARLPMLDAFDRLPAAVAAMFGPYLSSPGPDRRARREVRAQQLRALTEHYDEVREALSKQLPLGWELRQDVDAAFNRDAEAFRGVEPLAAWAPSGNGQDTDPLAKHAEILLRVLELSWGGRTAGQAYGSPPGGAPAAAGEHVPGEAGSAARGAEPNEAPAAAGAWGVRDWLRAAEDFVVLEITADLSRFFVQLRNLARSLTWAPLLALLALVSYPLHPQRFLLLIAAVVILILVVMAIRVLLEIEWDELISRIQKGTPGSIDMSWEFVRGLAIYIVPLLGILAAASAGTSDLLHGWLDPIAQVLK